ncbi:hypothetical protein I4U23_020287 [Adineta vaga]|nr:hypothetical protein I4U23_020287 [Adineta vaga]
MVINGQPFTMLFLNDIRISHLLQQLRVINSPPTVDDHDYQVPLYFIENFRRYEKVSQSGPKVLVGEFAVINDDDSKITNPFGPGRLSFPSTKSAIAESIYRIGLNVVLLLLLKGQEGDGKLGNLYFIATKRTNDNTLIVKFSNVDHSDILVKAQIQGSMASATGVAHILTAVPGIDSATGHNTMVNPNAAAIVTIPVVAILKGMNDISFVC